MKLDNSTTHKRIRKIKGVLNKENNLTIKELAKRVNLPETTTSLYVKEYLKDICPIKKLGREKRVFIIKNKISSFEKNLQKQDYKMELASKLRKKGFTYSEIKEKLNKKGFRIGDGTLSKDLRNIEISKLNKKRYIEKISEDRKNAGKIGGKIRVSMENFKDFQLLGTVKAQEKNLKKIPKSSKKLTLEKINIIGHCIFDGSVILTKRYFAIAYTNKSHQLINEFKENMLKAYNLEPTDLRKREEEISVIRYCCFAAVKDLKNLIKNGIPEKIIKGNKKQKIAFLRTFWDDEGAIHFGITKDKKDNFHISIYVEAFCEDELVRKQLIDIHESIGLPIIKYGKKIRISRKENLIKFQKEINFSPKVYISYPKSKFNKWEKRRLLDFALKFNKEDASNLYRKLWM